MNPYAQVRPLKHDMRGVMTRIEENTQATREIASLLEELLETMKEGRGNGVQ